MVSALAATLERLIVGLRPTAFVIPGSENARDDGAIDAWAWQSGEFSSPVYDKQAIRAALDAACEAQRAATRVEAAGNAAVANSIARDLDSIVVVKFLDDMEASRMVQRNANRVRALAAAIEARP